MQPPALNTSPGPEYADDARKFALAEGLEQTPGGRLWVVWVAGGDSADGYLLVATSDDRGNTWSKPRLVIDPSDAPGLKRRTLVTNLWCDPLGRLWLFFDQSMGYFDGRAGVWFIRCDNPDADKPEWSAPQRIWHGSTLNKPIVLKNGDWLLPISLWDRKKIRAVNKVVGPEPDMYRELDDQRMANVFASSDQGKTWTRPGGVRFPEADFDEHMMVERKDGSLWMLARTRKGICESVSTDAGKTWASPRPSAIQDVNARFFLRRLESGRLLLVKNGTSIDEKPKGRTQLSAFLSDDDGQTWKGGLVLDERHGVSYPDGFQARDGTLFITYDRNRSTDAEILMAVFSRQDVLDGRFTSPKARSKVMVNKATGKKNK